MISKIEWATGEANRLMLFHGLEDWIFRIGYCEKWSGACYFPLPGKFGVIELSKWACESLDAHVIFDTILHEIAHALTGYEHGHDEVWQKKCVEIGAIPVACLKR